MQLISKLLWGGQSISVARLNSQNQCSPGGYWKGTVDNRSTSTHFFLIFRAKKVTIKSPILKCKLPGFELKLNIKADIMFLEKQLCSL